MKTFNLIASLTIFAVASFAVNADNYQVKNKPALNLNGVTVAKTLTVSKPVVPTKNVYIETKQYRQPVSYKQPEYTQEEPRLSYAVQNRYETNHRSDILGEVVEVKRAPKQCEPTVKHEGFNTFLGVAVGGGLGNQIGKGNGRKVGTVAGALIGGAIANKHNRKNRGKVDCEGRGYLVTVAYVDDFGQVQYHTVRSDRRERKGDLLNIER